MLAGKIGDMSRKGVVTEARIYVTAGTIALLISAWAALATGDAIKQSHASQVPTVSQPATPNQHQPAPAPHTRTRGS
jgi:hypothetical protein